MGALTLKSFPFELRGWDIEKFESIDPTDGFGSSTRVYVSKDQIVLIEPDYNSQTFNTWLTDKGRQFFDGVFKTLTAEETKDRKTTLNKQSWLQIIKSITMTTYIFDHCNKQYSKNHFFTVLFENLSLEVTCLLLMISQNYSFLKLKRAENFNTNNDLEANFQLNLISDKAKLNSSTLCLLVSNNPRYEGYHLNLNLRQRFFKGNFKCLSIGSQIDLTFPVSFLGSNFKTLKSIAEGNHLVCQNIRFAKNPILVFNSEIFKRNDGKNIFEIIKVLKYSNIFNKTWNGFNVLNPSLYETGLQTLAKFSSVNEKDLTNFSSLYLINVTIDNLSNFKRITEAKLLNFSLNTNNQLTSKNKLFLDQNSTINNNQSFFNNLLSVEEKLLKKYLYLPTTMFYENQETFLNCEGLVKRTTKLISRKKTKNNWQILRRVFKHFKGNLTFLNQKENNIVFFNAKKISNFKNFVCFQFYATQSLTSLNFYLNIKNQPFSLNQNLCFKPKTVKINNTKLKYWLNDFFSGGKDDYSRNSLTMANCSKILRSENTNFF
jgi:NADH dehydrogenase/NADH:ubiquinone oxidoreductase subunit G